MKLRELLKMVFVNIFSSKSKCALTSLGIVAGSATIVLVIAVGQGGKADVAEQFKNLSAGAIEISAGQSADAIMEGMQGGPSGGGGPDFGGGMPDFGSMQMPSGGGSPSGGGFPSGGGGGFPGGGGGSFEPSVTGGVTLTEEDVEDISAVVPGIESISILASGDAAVDGGDLDEETDYTAVGVAPEYAEISNLTVKYVNFSMMKRRRTAQRYASWATRLLRAFSARHILPQVKTFPLKARITRS